MNFFKAQTLKARHGFPLLTILISASLLSACGPDDDDKEGSSCDTPQVLTADDFDGGATLDARCYRIEDRIEAKTGLVTLKPGVTIEFAQGAGLAILDEGRLSAEGTEEKPILLTGVEKEQGFWRGIHFRNSRSSKNILDYVTIEYGGGDEWSVHSHTIAGGVSLSHSDVTLTIKNSTFRENKFAGVFADGADADLSVSSSQFENNETPVRIAPNLVAGLDEDNDFGDSSYLLLTNTEQITTKQTWPAFPIPYRIDQNLKVQTDLTLSPGTTLEFTQDKGIHVDEGTLTADATDGDPIRFIAADGETINGFWRGIFFDSTRSSKNILANAEILYAGSSSWLNHDGGNSQAALLLRGNTTVQLSDVTIADSGKYGISIFSDGSVDPCDNVTFENNTDDDIYLDKDGVAECD